MHICICIYGAAWLNMVRRGLVGSASACCKAGPGSILGSAPQGGLPHWAYKRWRNGERLQRMETDEWIVIEWIYVCIKIWKINKKSGILPPNLYMYIHHYFVVAIGGGVNPQQGVGSILYCIVLPFLRSCAAVKRSCWSLSQGEIETSLTKRGGGVAGCNLLICNLLPVVWTDEAVSLQ